MTVLTEPRPLTGRRAATRFAASNAVAERFFGENADAIAVACQSMAGRFERGGRLFVCGDGAQRSDVAHVIVEFVHPVVVGKRALPAIPLPDIAGGAALGTLHTLASADDMLMILSATALDQSSRECLALAAGRGLLAIVLVGNDDGVPIGAGHVFRVRSDDAGIVQETHEMLYHVLWELVHVFFDHRTVGA